MFFSIWFQSALRRLHRHSHCCWRKYAFLVQKFPAIFCMCAKLLYTVTLNVVEQDECLTKYTSLYTYVLMLLNAVDVLLFSRWWFLSGCEQNWVSSDQSRIGPKLNIAHFPLSIYQMRSKKFKQTVEDVLFIWFVYLVGILRVRRRSGLF